MPRYFAQGVYCDTQRLINLRSDRFRAIICWSQTQFYLQVIPYLQNYLGLEFAEPPARTNACNHKPTVACYTLCIFTPLSQ